MKHALVPMSSQKGPSEKDPLAKVNSQTWSTWRTPAGRDPPRYSISPSVSCRAWSTWRTPARGISPRYSTIPSVRSRARSTWKTPASRVSSRYSISDDVNPQSYAHAYPLILLHLNTELILCPNRQSPMSRYETNMSYPRSLQSHEIS